MPHQQQPQGLHLGNAVSIFSETALNKAQSTQQPTRMLPDHSPLRKAERTMGFPAVSAEMTIKLARREWSFQAYYNCLSYSLSRPAVSWRQQQLKGNPRHDKADGLLLAWPRAKIQQWSPERIHVTPTPCSW